MCLSMQFSNGAADSGAGQQCRPVPEPNKVLNWGRTYTAAHMVGATAGGSNGHTWNRLALLSCNIFHGTCTCTQMTLPHPLTSKATGEWHRNHIKMNTFGGTCAFKLQPHTPTQTHTGNSNRTPPNYLSHTYSSGASARLSRGYMSLVSLCGRKMPQDF